MIEIILLFFLSKKMGDLAIEKGLSPGRWKLYTVLSWIVFELLGIIFGVILFGFDKNNIWGLMGFCMRIWRLFICEKEIRKQRESSCSIKSPFHHNYIFKFFRPSFQIKYLSINNINTRNYFLIVFI